MEQVFYRLPCPAAFLICQVPFSFSFKICGLINGVAKTHALREDIFFAEMNQQPVLLCLKKKQTDKDDCHNFSWILLIISSAKIHVNY
jgi:hypothetical protein